MGLAQTETIEVPNLYDSAVEAWAMRARLDENAAVKSLQHQLWTKVRVRREDYEVDTEMFPGEALPHLCVGAEVDGLTFCMNADHQLSIVNWRCSAKSCERIRRAPITDRVTLGRAIAIGHQTTDRFPKCDAHS